MREQPLILYFSVYGTDRTVAEIIQKETGGDLLEIISEIPYDACRDHYKALARRA